MKYARLIAQNMGETHKEATPKPKRRKIASKGSGTQDAAPGVGCEAVKEEPTDDVVRGSKEWRDEIDAWKARIDKGLQEYENDQKRMKRKERDLQKKYR